MITGEIKEVSPVNGNIIDLPPISASIENVSITVQTGGAVNSVNGKTGNVELTAEDVGALPYDTELRVIMPFYGNPSQEQTDEIIDIIEKIKAGGGNLPVFMDAGGSLLPAEYNYNARYDIITAVSHGSTSGVSIRYEIRVTPAGVVSTRSDPLFAEDINTGGAVQAPTVQAVAKYVEEQLAEGSQSGVQPDLSQNDPEAADYVKNRTHWIENAFEPIYANFEETEFDSSNTIADVGFGTFYKITDTILTREQLESATIEAYGGIGRNGRFTYNEEYSAMLGMDVFDYIIWHAIGNEELAWGLATNATESGSLLGGAVNIPSVGLYMDFPVYDYPNLTIKDETIHPISDVYLPPFYINYGVSLENATIVKVDDGEIVVNLSPEKIQRLQSSYVSRVRVGTDVGEIYFVTFMNNSNVSDRVGVAYSYGKFYALYMYFTNDVLHVSVKTLTTANDLTAKGYQTESQVKALINDAIANLPKYNGEVEEV